MPADELFRSRLENQIDLRHPLVQILHRGQAKALTRRQWRWIKRRQAVEPVIGHLKQDCRLN
ncbi:hypothetical protein, partial [Xanthomonas oryzae]